MKRAAIGIGILVLSSVLVPTSAHAVSPDDPWLRAACPDGQAIRLSNPESHEVIDLACEDARAIIGLNHDDRDPTLMSGPEHVGEARQPLVLTIFCMLIAQVIATITAEEVCREHPGDPGCEAGIHGGFFGGSLACEFLP